MTELELQELTDKIIAKLKADSLTIDQLTQTNVLTGMDFLELNSGRKVSLDDLRKFIRGYGIYLEIISKTLEKVWKYLVFKKFPLLRITIKL